MTPLVHKAAIGAALVATAALTSAPAEARDYYYHRHHDNTGTAIVAGIAGLAIGAALASGSHRDRYYDDGYYYPSYRSSYYYPRQTYYYYNTYPQYNGYYYDGYNRRYEREHRRWHRRHDYWGY